MKPSQLHPTSPRLAQQGGDERAAAGGEGEQERQVAERERGEGAERAQWPRRAQQPERSSLIVGDAGR